MYLAHFGLRAVPFALTPDPAFTFPSRSQGEALEALVRAIDSGVGFIEVTGEVGSGKTMLCQSLLSRLSRRAIYVPNPCLSPQALLSAIEPARASNLIVCLDQAQAMSSETLKTLERISNPSGSTTPGLQIVLFGRSELHRALARRELRSLRDRIAVRCRLGRLSGAETEAYLEHRLLAAGRLGGALFAAEVASAVHDYARGVPRLVNILAHKSLLLAAARGDARVTRRQVRAAAADTPRMSATRRLLARIQPTRNAFSSASGIGRPNR